MLIKKYTRKCLRFLLSMAVLILAFQRSAFAEELIDPEKDATLTIIYKDQEKPIEGALFQMYQVGDVSENGEFTLTGAFAAYPVVIEDLDSAGWKTLAETLYGYAKRDQLLPVDEAETDAYGALKFPDQQEHLTAGLYLIVGKKHIQNGKIYTAEPFMAWLPDKNAVFDAWSYDVTAIPKHENTPEDAKPEVVKRKVLKVWKDTDSSYKRPKEIVVDLLKDGTVYDTIALTEQNQWRYTWENLSGEHDWLVVEREVNGYTVSVEKEGITFVVTNTRKPTKNDEPDDDDDGGGGDSPKEPVKPDGPGDSGTPSESLTTLEEVLPPLADLPQTGQLWWPVPLLAAAGLMCIIAGCLIKRDHT